MYLQQQSSFENWLVTGVHQERNCEAIIVVISTLNAKPYVGGVSEDGNREICRFECELSINRTIDIRLKKWLPVQKEFTSYAEVYINRLNTI